MLESIVTEIRWKINEHKNRTGDPCIYLVPPTEILVPGITPYCLGVRQNQLQTGSTRRASNLMSPYALIL